jgi:glyoxylate/hydroxypyruvate reductase A
MLLIVPGRWFPDGWEARVRAALPEVSVAVWPEVPDPASVEAVMMGTPTAGVLPGLPSVRLVSTTGMGVEQLLALPDVPEHVVLCRVVDPSMVDRMSDYVALAALQVERDAARFERAQREGVWDQRILLDAGRKRAVGLMGFGEIGRDAARKLAALGFPVRGWSRTPKAADGVECFHGAEGLAPFLAGTEVLVCLLPYTPETDGILDARLFAMLPAGAHVVNVGRGAQLAEEDLLDALASGRLSGATLDVFRKEPLPPGHPFWTHPGVRITPHSAGLSRPHVSARFVWENLLRLKRGEAPLGLVDRARGY